MSPALFQVDAFTEQPFRGNPAAVCVLSAPRDDAWMLTVAAEMNLSETAFVVVDDEGDELPLRWFTPRVEVDLCGHATLATAHVLWESGNARPRNRWCSPPRAARSPAPSTATRPSGWTSPPCRRRSRNRQG